MRLSLSIFGACALGALLLGALACNPDAFKNKSTANNAPAAPSATAPQAPVPQPPADNVRRVTVDELKQLLAENKAVVIDVRGDAAYNAAHIKGSIMIPAAEIDKHANELPKDKLIVTYCS